jgi:SAM-dependent methyltransferase
MDFEKFYDHQPDYIAFRNDPSKRVEYEITVDWKARQLEKAVAGSGPFKNILEVGCAMGILLNNLANRLSIPERSGLDISSANINVAKELYPDVNFIQGIIDDHANAITQSLRISRFDLVLLSDIVEHIPDDLKFMKDVRGISTFVVLNLPLEKSFRTRNRKYGETDPSGHLRSYNEKDAIELIHSAGYDIVKSFTANTFSDKAFLDMYREKRGTRLKTKPLLRRLFWQLFYLAEDNLRMANKGLSEKIFGTNYFALLKNPG